MQHVARDAPYWYPGSPNITRPNLEKFDSQGNLSTTLGDSSAVDAFSRVRISDPVALFDSQFQYDEQPLLWFTTTTSGGSETHLPNESSVRLRVNTTSNASVIKQTKEYFRYQPGRSQFIIMTFVMGSTNTNVTKRIGYFDANNGIFLQQAGTGALSIVERTATSGSPSDSNSVAQASWNLDPLNGSGPSGVTLDMTKAQILLIDLQWLGVGRVRVGFDIAGKIIYAHEFRNANALTTVYMSTANLPLRYEIASTGVAGGTTDLQAICSGVTSEGGFTEERAYSFCATNGITTIGVTTRRPILSVRPKATFNSIVNRGRLFIEQIDLTTSGNPVLWEIVYNPTLTGAAFSSVDASSISEFDVAATTLSGGITIHSGYLGTGGATRVQLGSEFLTGHLPMVLDPAGANPINESLVITSFTGTATCAGSMCIREIR